MREAVQRIYRERKVLNASLKDVGSIVAKLDYTMLFCALCIIIFIWLLVLNPSNTLASLLPVATIILGFSFVFGNSAQKLFESVSAHARPWPWRFTCSSLSHAAHLHLLNACV